MNWKVRIKNKTFWLTVIPAVLLLIQVVAAVFGYTLDFGAPGRGECCIRPAGHSGDCERPHHRRRGRFHAGDELQRAEKRIILNRESPSK